MSATNDDEAFRVCGAQTSFLQLFQPKPFQVNAAVNNMHTKTPRFGHASDINLLIQGSKSEQQDYLTGLLAASFAVFFFFLFWMFCLTLFKCAGPSRVGFLSARRKLAEKPIKPEAVRTQEQYRKKNPFQHNGVAGVTAAKSPSHTKAMILKPVRGVAKVVKPVAKAPLSVVTKARRRKRELEKRSQFSRMPSDGSFDQGDIDELTAESPGTPTSVEQAPNGTLASTELGSSTAARSNELEGDSDTYFVTEEGRKVIQKYEKDWKEYEQQVHRAEDRIRRVRIGAGFCSIGILISAVLFTIMSREELIKSFESFKGGLDQVNDIADAGLDAVQKFYTRQTMSREASKKFLLGVNEVCPGVANQLCTNVENDAERQCNFTQIPFGEELGQLLIFFDGTLDYVVEELGDLEGDLLELKDMVVSANAYYPEHATWVFWTAASSALALGVICMILTAGMVMLEKNGELPRGFHWLRSWFLVPTMLLLVCISWTLSMVFILVGMGSSDLCYNSPDVPVLNLLANLEDEFSSIVYTFLRYFVSGCPVVEAPQGIERVVSFVQDSVLPALGNLADSFRAQSQEELESLCGTGSLGFIAIVQAVGNQLCALAQTMADVRAIFLCEMWYPLYQKTMHNAVCAHATQGFTWAASTQMVIVVLSLVLLSLRVSFYELEEVLKEGSGCCCYRGRQKIDSDDEVGKADVEKNGRKRPDDKDDGSLSASSDSDDEDNSSDGKNAEPVEPK